MDVASRVRLALAALVIVVGSMVFAAPALADSQPDPQLTNIPYLAWRGEQVRLVKCDPNMFGGAEFLQDGISLGDFAQGVQQAGIPLGSIFNADFVLVDWSGDPHLAGPQIEPGTQAYFFRSFDDAPCVSADFESPKAGLAQIKLAVTFNPGPVIRFFTGDVPPVLTGKHDFLVGWMKINAASLSNVAGGSGPLTGPISELPGSFNDLQVVVSGSIPLLQNYGELGIGDELILPNDWAKLANAVATFRDPAAPNPAFFWDIHDDNTPNDGVDDLHGAQSSCIHNTPVFVDVVDNCEPTLPPADTPGFNGNVPDLYEIGAFSRVWQGFTNPTVGPFDPQRPFETLLSDGKLDAFDAPMPSDRVDFAIAANTPGGINGVGSFCTIRTQDPLLVNDPGDFTDCHIVDKHIVYSHDGLGSTPPSPNAPHNLYAPFYAEYLPAAYPSPLVKAGRDQPEASGIDGPPHGNNFPGFLNENSFYHYWDVLNPQNFLGEVDTACNQFVDSGDETGGAPDPEERELPEGFQTVSVYTDEHGEARVRFSSGVGFFFDNLPVVLNANGGCDLAGIATLGTADITATAKYPYQPVTAQPVTSNVLTKVITNGFSKTLICAPKGAGAANSVAAICIAEAIDITGEPIEGETVCFVADFNASSIQPFFGTIEIGGRLYDLAGSTRNTGEEGNGTHRICVDTNSDGLAAVEVINSNPTTVDVTAFFVDEGLFRSIHVPFPILTQIGPVGTSQGAPPASTPAPPSTIPGGTNPGGSNPGGSNPSGNNNDNASPGVKHTIAMAKVVRTSKTRATLIVRVKGPAGKSTLRIKLQKGRRSITYTRAVKANKTVKIRGLKLPTGTGALRASLSVVS